MKKEQLYECPMCGQPNFTRRGLRSHWCPKKASGRRKSGPLDHDEWQAIVDGRWAEFTRERAAESEPPSSDEPVALEILPPADPKAVAACVKQLRKQMITVATRSRELVYDVVGAGVYLLKLRDLHLAQGARRDLTSGNVSTGDVETPGFLKVIESEFCRTDIEDEEERRKHVAAVQRSARNYMNAARNAGLDGTATLADVKRLKKQGVLDDRNASELYKLKNAAPVNPEPPQEQPKYNLIRDEAVALRERCENIITLREHMSEKAYQTVCARLQRTLEDLTGTGWTMTKGTKGAPLFQEHGDVYELGS